MEPWLQLWLGSISGDLVSLHVLVGFYEPAKRRAACQEAKVQRHLLVVGSEACDVVVDALIEQPLLVGGQGHTARVQCQRHKPVGGGGGTQAEG